MHGSTRRRHVAIRPTRVYAIVRHGDHSNFAYVLEVPRRQSLAECELNSNARRATSLRSGIPTRPPSAGLDPEHDEVSEKPSKSLRAGNCH